MSRRSPISISLNAAELHKLDTWAAHHDVNRSQAVRLLIMSVRLPDQATLDLDFEVIAEVEPVDLPVQPHAAWCDEPVRSAWGRSNPYLKEGPCPVCWPDGAPPRDEVDEIHEKARMNMQRYLGPRWLAWVNLNEGNRQALDERTVLIGD